MRRQRLAHPVVIALGHGRNESAAIRVFVLQQALEGRCLGIVRLGRRIRGRKNVRPIIVDEVGEHGRHTGIALLFLLHMESRGDFDFFAFYLRLRESHLQLAVGRGWRSEVVRSNTDPALKDFGGATGATLTMRPFFRRGLTRCSSGISLAPPLPRKATAPMPAAETAGSRDRARCAGIDKRHFGGMHRTGDRLLNIGVPARALRFDAGHHARHILIGCDRWKSDPDAKPNEQRRKIRRLVQAGGGRQPFH